MDKAEKYKAITDGVVKKLAGCKKIDAIGYMGSLATGLSDDFSDIDIICIVADYPSVEERRNLLGEQDYVGNNFTVYYEAFRIDGITVDISLRQTQWFEDVLTNKELVNDFNEKYVLFLLETVQPLWDPKGLLKSFKHRAVYTNEYAKAKIEYLFGSLAEAKDGVEQLVKRGDLLFIDRAFVDLLEKYVAAVFALNRHYYSDLKWALVKLEGFGSKPEGVVESVKRLSEIGNRPDDVKYKMKLFKRMLLELSELAEKEMPEAKIGDYVKEIKKW